MAKFLALLCIALFMVTIAEACVPASMCSSDADCCGTMCNPWAGLCTGKPVAALSTLSNDNGNSFGNRFGPWRFGPWPRAANAGWNWPPF